MKEVIILYLFFNDSCCIDSGLIPGKCFDCANFLKCFKIPDLPNNQFVGLHNKFSGFDCPACSACWYAAMCKVKKYGYYGCYVFWSLYYCDDDFDFTY